MAELGVTKTHSRPPCLQQHHHAGLGLLTPHDVHQIVAAARIAARAAVLAAAYAAHSERFPRGASKPQALHNAVWINDPRDSPPLRKTRSHLTNSLSHPR